MAYRVRQTDFMRVAGVPEPLRDLDLLAGRFQGERGLEVRHGGVHDHGAWALYHTSLWLYTNVVPMSNPLQVVRVVAGQVLA